MGMNSPSALLVVHHFFFPQLSFQDWRVTPPRAGPCCRRNATGCPKSRPWRGEMMQAVVKMSHFGHFEHHLKKYLLEIFGDHIPNIWVM